MPPVKTAAGQDELTHRSRGLGQRHRTLLLLVDGRRSSDEGPGALIVTGHGLRTNIIEASLEAYLAATNKLHGAEINGISVAFVGGRSAEDLP